MAANPTSMTVLLGDYIDRGPDSLAVLTTVRELAERYPQRVVALLGNHETDFLDWLDGENDDVDWLLADTDHGLATVRSFLGTSAHDNVAHALQETACDDVDALATLNAIVKLEITRRYGNLLQWLRRRPLCHETNDQIFVHAGVDETAGTHWRIATPDHVLVGKFPPSTGPFTKTVIAGHVATADLNPDGSHGILFDGHSHYYLDGSVEHTGRLNVLSYDTETKRYGWFAVGPGAPG